MTEESFSELLLGNLGVMMLSAGIWTLAGQLVWPFQALYVLRLGGSSFHIGLIASIGAIAGIFPTILGGYFADTVGRKKMIYSMSFLLALNSLIFFVARDWKWLIIGTVVGAIASGLRQPAFSAIIADCTSEENRAQVYALWSIAPPLFGILSPYFMGVFMDRYGTLPMIRTGYFILFVLSFIAAGLRFLFLKETLTEAEFEKQSIVDTSRSIFFDIKESISNLSRPLWILGIMGLFFGFGAAVGGPFWVTYATEDVLKLSLTQWGIITAANSLTSIIVGLPLAWISDKKGRLFLLIPSVALTPIAIIAFIYSQSFMHVFLISIVITVFGSMGMSSGQAFFSDLTDKEHRGRINALWNVAGTMQSFRIGLSPGSLLGATGNFIGGYFYENVSKQLPLMIQSVMVGLSAVTGIIFLKEPKRESELE